ncbi:type I pantothenate kinase [Paenibacillus sp. J2TS4]|uniref:type I pantothenate kinase n=1 Tax=Paenibacillus sp. J2TS4 TaxID=2807194 RepID=UPI001B15FECB|nr:type I pantothenate kinase [Paenibacillus sp. J2TS4]GIP34322.1 pantothenate kinase [Paenibacillus sp. J2TS4]
MNSPYSPYTTFTPPEWGKLYDDSSESSSLTAEDLLALQGINESLSLEQIREAYLPLSKLLNLIVETTIAMRQAKNLFLKKASGTVPFIIGIAGSVAVGKSTTARLLQKLLSCGPSHPRVDLVTTDGFLYPNEVLVQRGIMAKKGFPESYDTRRLIQFLADVKSGVPQVECPVYSHLEYDIVKGKKQRVIQPDIVIMEGLNVLQTNTLNSAPDVFVSDFFDFSIYVDADSALIENWYIDRFKILRNTAFQSEHSYFHKYSTLTETEAVDTARSIWQEINYSNLIHNILPTRSRADLILTKTEQHKLKSVHIKK